MDFQKMFDALFDALCKATSEERSRYHVTLGDLTVACEANPNGRVFVDTGNGLRDEHSYRGYYNELSFHRDDEPTPTADVLAMCRRAASDTYEGYKGGDYTYNERTPLWLAPYGCTGAALVSLVVRDGDIFLTSKDVGL
jgi:hypothetical protein